MPGKDKTGPEGKGPMTGRGFGGCNPKQQIKRILKMLCRRRVVVKEEV